MSVQLDYPSNSTLRPTRLSVQLNSPSKSTIRPTRLSVQLKYQNQIYGPVRPTGQSVHHDYLLNITLSNIFLCLFVSNLHKMKLVDQQDNNRRRGAIIKKVSWKPRIATITNKRLPGSSTRRKRPFFVVWYRI